MAKDQKLHAKARALYESGLSYSQIADQLPVSPRSLKSWCKAGKWVKGASAQELHRKEQVALERDAERRGITKAKVLDKIAELIDATSVAVITTQGAVSLCPMLPDAEVKEGKSGFMGIDYDVVPDRKTQLSAAQLAADVLGMKKQQEAPDLANSILAWVRSQA